MSKIDRVEKCYMEVLKRLPDEEGMKTYLELIEAGKSSYAIKRILRNSGEYERIIKYDSSKFDDFIESAKEKLLSKTITPALAKTKCAVIVEGRKLLCFQTVVNLTMYFLGPEWALQVVCTNENETFCRDVLCELKNVTFTIVSNMNNVKDYNVLLLSTTFWEDILIGIDNVLIFQTDSFLCRKGIDEFLDVHYIGARSLCDKVMNGGLSLRKRNKMIEILEANTPKLYENEDVFFSRLINTPPVNIQDSFSLEQRCYNNKLPLGVHKLWFYCPDKVIWIFEQTLENLSA